VIHAAAQLRTSGDPVHAMFHRVLAGWAMDALTLRRSGLDRPCSRVNLAPVRPGRDQAVREHGRRSVAQPVIGWRPGMDSAARA
jgi:hypothetical protein